LLGLCIFNSFVVLVPASILEESRSNDIITGVLCSLSNEELCEENKENMVRNNTETLGLGKSIKGRLEADTGKIVKPRGRKSLAELRAKEGMAPGQVKITDILYSGKGKVLPESS
jgi:hypothetical protein